MFENMSDEELTPFINQRNPDAVAVLFSRHHKRMASIVANTTKCSLADGEDAVQYSFTRWLMSDSQADKPVGLLMHTAKCARIRAFRQASRYHFNYIDEPIKTGSNDIKKELAARETPTAEPLDLPLEQLPTMREKLDTLPPQFQEILRLRYFSGLSFLGCALQLGIDESSAQRRCYRAIKLLKSAMGLIPPVIVEPVVPVRKWFPVVSRLDDPMQPPKTLKMDYKKAGEIYALNGGNMREAMEAGGASRACARHGFFGMELHGREIFKQAAAANGWDWTVAPKAGGKKRRVTSEPAALPIPIQLSLPAIPAPEQRPAIVPLEQMERTAIMDAMHKFYGDMIQAAKALGIGKSTMHRKLVSYREKAFNACAATDEAMRLKSQSTNEAAKGTVQAQGAK